MKALINKVIRRLNKIVSNKQYLRLFPAPTVEVLASEWPEFHDKGAGKKILYLAAKYDYGDKSKGISYEEYNFFYTLKNMDGVETIRLDVYSLYHRYGKDITNQVIKEVALLEGVDTVLLCLFHDIFDHQLFKDLSENYPIETVLWLFDDDKRYLETFSLVQCFNKVVTTIDIRHQERVKAGINSHLAQFAANHFLYKNYGLKKEYDVVFVGQNFGNRQEYIEYLKESGINVFVFGRGWPDAKRLTQVEMIELLNKAKLALNFSSSADNPELKFLKGRIFEIPATGTMLLTEVCENLEDYFTVGEHLDVFAEKEELLNKIKTYLSNEQILEEISANGQKLVSSDYTFEKYLREVM